MKLLYNIGLAVIITLTGSCTGKKSDNVSSGDTAILSEEISNANIDVDNSSAASSTEAGVIKDDEDFVSHTLIENGLPSVIDFSATWCGPCQKMKPVFHKLAKEFKDEYNFITIDIDEYPELASKYHIQAVPTFVFIDEDGEEGDRITGAVSENVLRDMLQNPAWF